uniref:Potassium channel domain-containing protein n=1 Tax=Plectus sambesii TaxID=2011161 RepID=A0A914XCP7_9BILA
MASRLNVPEFNRLYSDWVSSRAEALADSTRTASERVYRNATRITRNASNRLTEQARSVKESGVRFQEQALQSTRTVANFARSAGRRTVQTLHKRPLCFSIMQNFYHRYGMKHAILILILLFYAFFGAFVFLIIEAPHQTKMKAEWNSEIAVNRSRFVSSIMSELFNNSRFLIYVKGKTTDKILPYLSNKMVLYEDQLEIKWSDQKMEWDYWNAVLFCGTLCTTIGYGHIYPHTSAGKIMTMVYALGGIPLVLLVLQDLGKLLTVLLKYPWFQFKRGFRRCLRYCTKQSMKEIRLIEQDEREKLHIFDLPLVVGIALIIGWVFLCAVTFSYSDSKWTLLEAFYFFFISLSTIGLGDLVPTHPRLLLMMFGVILIGLSLVSMVINLLQVRMRNTYEAGRMSRADDGSDSIDLDRITLGVLQCYTPTGENTSNQSFVLHQQERSSIDASLRSILRQERMVTRSTQTNLSLPTVRQ